MVNGGTALTIADFFPSASGVLMDDSGPVLDFLFVLDVECILVNKKLICFLSVISCSCCFK